MTPGSAMTCKEMAQLPSKSTQSNFFYSPNGNIEFGKFKNDKKVGEWILCRADGLRYIINYMDSVEINRTEIKD